MSAGGEPVAAGGSALRGLPGQGRGWVLSALVRDGLVVVSMLWLVLVATLVIFGARVAPHDATKVDLSAILLPPGSERGGEHFWLGTDPLGRDYLSRLVVGARQSILIGLGAATFGTVVGLALGSAAGYFRGKLDAVVSRVVDTQMSFPGLLLALLILASVGTGPEVEIVVLAIASWVGIARIARGMALEIREALYVDAAKTMGVGSLAIVRRHVIPNLLSPILVLSTVLVASLMIASAGLDFLGVGIQPPETSWGLLVSDGRDYISTNWWLVVFPGLCILLTAIAINVVAMWLRAISDVTTRAALLREVHVHPELEAGGQVPATPGTL